MTVIDFIRILFRFIILLLLQVLLMNNIEFSSYLNPQLYLLFLLMLPFETANWLLMLLGFFTGISIDYFNDTMGMHAAACTFIMYLRPKVLKFFSPRDGYEPGVQPTVKALGPVWYFYYAGIMIVSHHFLLFFIEVFRFSEFFHTFFKIIVSSIFTLIVIFIAQYLVYAKSENK